MTTIHTLEKSPPSSAAARNAAAKSAAPSLPPSGLARLKPYASIARPDHWFKNVFMALGVLLAYFYHPELLQQNTLLQILWAVATTRLLASTNYSITDILYAPP